MSMDTVKDLMKEARIGFLATTDGERPAVRPMGGWAWVEDELWAATFARSAKVAEINKKPRAEVCFMVPDFRNVRIAGVCTISTDQGDKDRLYEMVPILKQHIPDPTSPDYVVLRIKPDSARLMESESLGTVEVWPGG